ncbi:hypothetical protein BV22DRAFT_1051281 [Leucogyrophana mollusca]|uniref:Uncharacterized protein n=1 Tax=Leucogyrophana mollusca TaxID=85980 RepID=A0ACB8B2M9_9AGAM|nr:hypothetical protein BV22DRAFT_1051281 [Leucogyrophana mollusca]
MSSFKMKSNPFAKKAPVANDLPSDGSTPFDRRKYLLSKLRGMGDTKVKAGEAKRADLSSSVSAPSAPLQDVLGCIARLEADVDKARVKKCTSVGSIGQRVKKLAKAACGKGKIDVEVEVVLAVGDVAETRDGGKEAQPDLSMTPPMPVSGVPPTRMSPCPSVDYSYSAARDPILSLEAHELRMQAFRTNYMRAMQLAKQKEDEEYRKRRRPLSPSPSVALPEEPAEAVGVMMDTVKQTCRELKSIMLGDLSSSQCPTPSPISSEDGDDIEGGHVVPLDIVTARLQAYKDATDGDLCSISSSPAVAVDVDMVSTPGITVVHNGLTSDVTQSLEEQINPSVESVPCCQLADQLDLSLSSVEADEELELGTTIISTPGSDITAVYTGSLCKVPKYDFNQPDLSLLSVDEDEQLELGTPTTPTPASEIPLVYAGSLFTAPRPLRRVPRCIKKRVVFLMY